MMPPPILQPLDATAEAPPPFNGPAGATILRHPAALASPPLSSKQYLDRCFDLDSAPIPFVRFAGVKNVVPDYEGCVVGRHAFLREIAPDPAPVIGDKAAVPYFIGGTLKDAELVNVKIRATRLAKSLGTIGKQRSSAHIASLGPAILLDHDGDVFGREEALRASGAACAIYSSFSYGFSKAEGAVPTWGGRIILFLNRPITTEEYGPIWDAINHLLGGDFDEHGRSPALCYGRHARRSAEAPYRRAVLDGAALDADALLVYGRSLRSQPAAPSNAPYNGATRRTLLEEIERARLLGVVLPPDRYGDWIAGAGAFKRALPGDSEGAFRCFDEWSACSKKYEGTAATRRKFDQVPVEYAGTADPATTDMLHWRARRRAEAVIGAAFPPKWALSALPPQQATVRKNFPESSDLANGIPLSRGAEAVSPDNVTAEDGVVAADYLLFCWSKNVLESLLENHSIPNAVLQEATRRGEERRERIDLAGRTLHRWEGKNLADDTRALCTAIVESGAKLYRIDNALVRISAPASDESTATRVRNTHGYTGESGGSDDPVRYAGERVVPLLPSDPEALREIVAEHIATKRRVNLGTKTAPDWREVVTSFGFKPTARLHEEPDAGVLKDVLKREIVAQVPEIRGVITAPVMPDLPRSNRPEDLIKATNADRVIAKPGFDSASGLYLSPLGTIVDVAAEPSAEQVKDASDLLLKPWDDFPFVSPGADLSDEVSRSACVYGTMLAANRRALEIAPGVAVTSHGEGMSSGKTLAGEVLCTIATGETPAPVSLSPDFTEQRKEIITHLLEGDGCLFLDNIPTGTRFDVAPLASSMTSETFKGRLLGANKQIKVGTRVMVVATGNSVNMAGDLASRFLLARLDTGLERPEDRSVDRFKITDLRRWVVKHRQQLVAAVHTIVRGYLQECTRQKGTPDWVATRRGVTGTRFGGPCEVLRDALLWAFPALPDPFLSFQASAADSSTKAEAQLMLGLLDDVMVRMAGNECAPVWAKTHSTHGSQSPERRRWEPKFRNRWVRMTDHERQRRFGTNILSHAEDVEWCRVQSWVRTKLGRRELRAGRRRFTTTEILLALRVEAKETVEAATTRAGGKLNPIALGRWLKDRLVDAPLGGLVLRSAQNREKRAGFWITEVGATK
jgi:hypothetical protein